MVNFVPNNVTLLLIANHMFRNKLRNIIFIGLHCKHLSGIDLRCRGRDTVEWNNTAVGDGLLIAQSVKIDMLDFSWNTALTNDMKYLIKDKFGSLWQDVQRTTQTAVEASDESLQTIKSEVNSSVKG